MSATVEVFADITCPFTHVGLTRLTRHLTRLDRPPRIHVRAWPLEWVNGKPLDPTAVAAKIEILQAQLGVDCFSGFRPDRWPDTTIPALNLVAAAYKRGLSTGFEVSRELRIALFEEGLDIGDPAILGSIAMAHELPAPRTKPSAAVLEDYAEGRRRGVSGSPHFWIGSDDYFCPLLDIGHDRAGALTASFASEKRAQFISRMALAG